MASSNHSSPPSTMRVPFPSVAARSPLSPLQALLLSASDSLSLPSGHSPWASGLPASSCSNSQSADRWKQGSEHMQIDASAPRGKHSCGATQSDGAPTKRLI
ncbi:hypothetical protein N431DRAFT_430011, partial [Stipitochalara longipes BDJ]